MTLRAVTSPHTLLRTSCKGCLLCTAGRDPKPFPPPMKLCKEMVDAMGGSDNEHYLRFRAYCCEAYNVLRKNANLLLSLFHLMAGAAIPDVRSDPEKAMLKLQVSGVRCGSTSERLVLSQMSA